MLLLLLCTHRVIVVVIVIVETPAPPLVVVDVTAVVVVVRNRCYVLPVRPVCWLLTTYISESEVCCVCFMCKRHNKQTGPPKTKRIRPIGEPIATQAKPFGNDIRLAAVTQFGSSCCPAVALDSGLLIVDFVCGCVCVRVCLCVRCSATVMRKRGGEPNSTRTTHVFAPLRRVGISSVVLCCWNECCMWLSAFCVFGAYTFCCWWTHRTPTATNKQQTGEIHTHFYTIFCGSWKKHFNINYFGRHWSGVSEENCCNDKWTFEVYIVENAFESLKNITSTFSVENCSYQVHPTNLSSITTSNRFNCRHTATHRNNNPPNPSASPILVDWLNITENTTTTHSHTNNAQWPENNNGGNAERSAIARCQCSTFNYEPHSLASLSVSSGMCVLSIRLISIGICNEVVEGEVRWTMISTPYTQHCRCDDAMFD